MPDEIWNGTQGKFTTKLDYVEQTPRDYMYRLPGAMLNRLPGAMRNRPRAPFQL